jgi:hypothetical protein
MWHASPEYKPLIALRQASAKDILITLDGAWPYSQRTSAVINFSYWPEAEMQLSPLVRRFEM